jgi:hypothetical protein
MPQLFRFLLLNAGLGIFMSWLLLAGLITADVWGLGSLVSRSADGILAVAMLAAGFAITFGGAAVATATLLMRYEDLDYLDGGGTTKTFRLKRFRPPRTNAPVSVKIPKRST